MSYEFIIVLFKYVAMKFIQIETKAGEKYADVDMAVVLITDSTLMPDRTTSIVTKEEDEDDKEAVTKIMDDLKSDLEVATKIDGGDTKKSFVNSFITEVKVQNAVPDDFKLNVFMKPTIDIVSYLNTMIILTFLIYTVANKILDDVRYFSSENKK